MKVLTVCQPLLSYAVQTSLAGGFGDWLAGFADGEGCFYIQRLSSRRLVESVGRGEVRASADLFD